MPTTNPVQVLEHFTLVAPLGLRFHDAATGELVGDGLNVTVYPIKNTLQRVEARANRSGTYVLHHAPGLREFERGAGDEEFWNNLPPTQTFVVEVIDQERRFQPFSFEAELPAPRGLFNWLSPVEPSPPAGARSLPLYSAPARKVSSGMAVVRADLWDAQASAPAAWAVVEARLNNQLQARGMSDERGRLALIFPYPKPTDAPLSSPVASPPVNKNVPLLEQTWELALTAGYAPEDLATAAKPPVIPDLRTTLDQLNAPPARLWADLAGQDELLSVTLKYGQELILKSQDSTNVSPPAPQSVLFITPAGSPP
ncbi:MAG TPA: hypothetical protein VGW12_13885 [Pyrinomonadaceae bacterium]|nr:hypothetical protein [Pyrinomonadaceae bacterium]